MGPHPAVATVRRAVRASLEPLRGSTVIVACSGGPDSLALAGAAAFVAPSVGLNVHGISVDHQLQPGSAVQAARAQQAMQALGIGHTTAVSVEVPPDSGLGMEAAARRARYEALAQQVQRLDARAVLLGHTQDDQAETVLLGLARGSGARSLAGMAAIAGVYRRPLLQVPRAVVAQACTVMCQQAGLDGHMFPWQDPHNEDHKFKRVAVRHVLMPVMEKVLGGPQRQQKSVEEHTGGAISRALARTAAALQEDNEALDQWAQQVWSLATSGQAGLNNHQVTLHVSPLAQAPAAVAKRVLHRACLSAGCPPGHMSREHVSGVYALVAQWEGQKGVSLPCDVRACRAGDFLMWIKDRDGTGSKGH